MNDNTRAMKDMKDKGGNAINELGRMIGVDVNRMTTSFKQFSLSTKLLSSGFKGAAVGSGVLSGALKILKLALVSTGVGAIVVVLGTLIAYLTQTKKGTYLMKQAWESVKSVFDVLIDRIAGFGSGMASILEGIWNFDYAKVKEGATELGKSFKGVGTEIKNEAKAAWDLQNTLNLLDDRQTKLMKVNSDRKAQISELILLTRKEKVSNDEKMKALAKANALEKAIIESEIKLQSDRVSVYREQHKQGNDLLEDERELAAEEVKLNDLRTQGNSRLRELTNRYTELTNKINATSKAMRKQADEQNKYITGPMESIQPFDISSIEKSLKGIPDAAKSANDELKIQAEEMNSTLGKMGQSTKEASEDAKQQAGIIESSLEGFAIGIASTLGSMAIGNAGVEDLGNVLLGSLAGVMVQLGEMSIATAIGVKAIQTALTSLQWPVALAAGIALVALGTAIRGSMKSIGSGMGSGGSGGSFGGSVTPRTSLAGSTYSNLSCTSSTQTIHIEGKIRGSDLWLLAEREQDRRRLST